jgi:hypothetical protein
MSYQHISKQLGLSVDQVFNLKSYQKRNSLVNILEIIPKKVKRFYVHDSTKVSHDESDILTDFEVSLLSDRLDRHLHGVIEWIDKNHVKEFQDSINIRYKSQNASDPKHIENQKVRDTRANILEPIYDFAIAMRKAAESGNALIAISRPKGGYEGQSFDSDIQRRATAMIDVVKTNNLELIIGEDKYNSEQFSQNDKFWRFVCRTLDISVRLGLNKNEFMELINSEIVRVGSEITDVFVERPNPKHKQG